MKYLQIMFGISIGVFWFSYYQSHDSFISATAVTTVYIVLIIVIKKWFTGEFDKAIGESSINFKSNEYNTLCKTCSRIEGCIIYQTYKNDGISLDCHDYKKENKVNWKIKDNF